MASTRELSDSAVLRTPTDGETLVVQNHLVQMLTFMLKSGLRFFPVQDGQLKQREKFIGEILQKNKMDLYYWGIGSLFLTTGSILWYLRPVGEEGYEIHWYIGGNDQDRRQYKAVYKLGGRELDYVVIRYSFKVQETGANQFNGTSTPGTGKERWIRLIVTAEQIIEQTFYRRPSLDIVGGTENREAPIGQPVVSINTLGFVPCVESANDPLLPGDGGHGEFDAITNQIETEDELRASMVSNAFLFNSQTLVTTKPKEQILEAMGSDSQRAPQTWAGAQGYHSFQDPGFGGSVPFVTRANHGRRVDRNERVARVIGQVRDGERIGYIQPQPLNSDIWRFAQEYREGLHQALGSIDPLSYRHTDWQSLRGLVGQVECTAKRKCTSLFTHGLAELLRMAIVVEERLFLLSYKNWMAVNVYGIAPEAVSQVIGQITDDMVMQHFYAQTQLPPGVQGIPPYGDRTVRWQWLGPLFEPDSREKQVATINARNLQEAGVGSIHALRELFPGRTDKEIKAMLTGVPLRYAQDVTNTLNQLVSLQQLLMTIPDTQTDPTGVVTLGQTSSLVPLIQQIMGNFYKQVNNEDLYDPNDPNTEPTSPRNFDVQFPVSSSTIPTLSPSTYDWSSAVPAAGRTVSGSAIDPGTLLSGLGWSGLPLPAPGGTLPLAPTTA